MPTIFVEFTRAQMHQLSAWCDSNVGAVEHYAMSGCCGQGWHIMSVFLGYSVEIQDPKLATLFALTWS